MRAWLRLCIPRGLLVLFAWLAGCGGASQVPTPTPVPSPLPPTRSAPAVAPATAAAGVVFESPRYGYAITLPCCWVALPAPATAVEAALADLENNRLAPELNALAQRLRPQAVSQALELIAVLPAGPQTPTPVAQLTVSVLPRAGLTPAAYLAATRAELARIPGTLIERAEVDWTLRNDGIPAVVIEYTTPGSSAQATIGGMQVALPSTEGAYFIVLTFTSALDDYARLQPQFRQIVRLVEPDPAAQDG